ncbi:glycine betaine ABC transporter substrate-binding protein [Salipaludibacillus aurantiacus]|uniref:Glycine betaine/proline transport system substrate-binding protein n=1 Tax=Salipaludibacillus aurantiacus TaxID=1601833 RepID=A0A1H9TY72_9BACI|nr:glycine betaine ABC transporter substrate-binding protein [Salipaludibacillus aurantiacus]SES02076.1 glycine betaine/proline transport system substrate-binding protein [Salipaludibacillus aurantiacus]
MYKLKKELSLSLSLLMVAVLAACGTSEGETDSLQSSEESEAESNDESEVNNGEIMISQISWAENIAVTNMWKSILEDKGYEVELSLMEMGVSMAALESGGLDVNLEVWLPVQDANYLDQYGDSVNFSEETWFDNAKVGLVVPEYVEEVNSIEDLNEHRELFDSKIIGLDAGAGTMEVTDELIKDYDLDFDLLASSEPAMLGELESAIDNEEPIVVPLWTPHWVFSAHDLKFLDDPQKIYGDVEKIHHATRQGFEEDYPEVSEWFKNWKMDDEEIGELIEYVESAEEPIDGAEKWIEENQDLIDEWVN